MGMMGIAETCQNMKRIWTFVCLWPLTLVLSANHPENHLTCGVAVGFPPYQYVHEDQPQGLDVDVLRLISKNMKAEIEILQKPWIEVMSFLRYGVIDCAGGMEVTEKRREIFDFTKSYYYRQIVVITLAENTSINTLKDLHLKKVGRDIHSPLETHLKGLTAKIAVRLVKVTSKNQAFHALRHGSLDALIIPHKVALFLSEKYEVPIKFVGNVSHKIPVAIAVKKGKKKLLGKLEKTLHHLSNKQSIQPVVQKYSK
jgi:polar amino acid transport system substrate-binding protein